ncbi:MAG: sodium:neurotransmitter symporter [Clostridia bacterium]|jgi:NSS family neurotransmitter:Na+ symporter|nr:sodium:neurotransmitter symporter [Clostridia bacterium]
MENGKRAQWGSNFGFIMAAAGSAVGLGNLWKFPYLAGKNGGGVFVLIYLLIVLFIGFTIMLGEMAIGRSTQLSSYNAYRKINKKWSYVGAIGVIAGFIILSFYSVVGGWVLNYLYQTVIGGIPTDTSAYFGSFISDPISPIFWDMVFMIATAIIVFKGIGGGIEKACKFMMPALFVILVIISIRAMTLPGAGAGIAFYLTPDFSKLTAGTIVAALGQVFFSLSLGMGCIITYGSYLGKEENLEKNSIIVPFLDTLVALLAGFAILPAVFAFGFEPGSGPGLMFITLPQVFDKMPLGWIFGTLFFILVLFAALTSSISLLEVTVAYMQDHHKWGRTKAVIVLSLLMFLISIPASLSMGILSNVQILGNNLFDFLVLISDILLPLGGLLMCIFIGYVWGMDKALAEITNNGKFPFKLKGFWTIMIKYIAPLAVIVVFLNALGILKL